MLLEYHAVCLIACNLLIDIAISSLNRTFLVPLAIEISREGLGFVID